MSPAGEIFSPTGWERCPRALALKETCRDGLAEIAGKETSLADARVSEPGLDRQLSGISGPHNEQRSRYPGSSEVPA